MSDHFLKQVSENIRSTVHQFHCRGGSIFLEGGVDNKPTESWIKDELNLLLDNDSTRHNCEILAQQTPHT